MKRFVIAVLCFSTFVFAKDKKEEEAPVLTQAQNIELLQAQIAYWKASAAAIPFDIAVNQAVHNWEAKVQEVSAGVDAAKWTFDAKSMTFVRVPPPPPVPSPAPAPAPAVPAPPSPAPGPAQEPKK